MEPITRETFNRWAQKNNWMLINEGVTPAGRQFTFITPSGSLVFVNVDLKGNVATIGQPMPIPPSALGLPKGPV